MRVKLSKRVSDLEREQARLFDETIRLTQGLNDVLNNKVVWVHKEFEVEAMNSKIKKSERCSYHFGVSRLTGPSGGLFFVRFHSPGQEDHTAVYLLDDMDWQRFPEVFWKGIEEARKLRSQECMVAAAR